MSWHKYNTVMFWWWESLVNKSNTRLPLPLSSIKSSLTKRSPRGHRWDSLSLSGIPSWNLTPPLFIVLNISCHPGSNNESILVGSEITLDVARVVFRWRPSCHNPMAPQAKYSKVCELEMVHFVSSWKMKNLWASEFYLRTKKSAFTNVKDWKSQHLPN